MTTVLQDAIEVSFPWEQWFIEQVQARKMNPLLFHKLQTQFICKGCGNRSGRADLLEPSAVRSVTIAPVLRYSSKYIRAVVCQARAHRVHSWMAAYDVPFAAGSMGAD